ncbi:MAG: hypothetical protein AAB932_04110 [Patescibacteria group bacterium]
MNRRSVGSTLLFSQPLALLLVMIGMQFGSDTVWLWLGLYAVPLALPAVVIAWVGLYILPFEDREGMGMYPFIMLYLWVLAVPAVTIFTGLRLGRFL